MKPKNIYKTKAYRVEFILDEIDRTTLLSGEIMSLIFKAENEEQAKEMCEKDIKKMGFTLVEIVTIKRIQ